MSWHDLAPRSSGFGSGFGSGFEMFRNICEAENAPFPEIEFNESYFYVTFRQSKEYLELAGEEESRLAEGWYERWYEKWYEYGLSKREIEVLAEIKSDPKISIKGLSDKLGIYPSAIQKHIVKLKQRGVLRRVGPAKGGHWEVVEK
jgi:ATP-dependent DNA helicase RecG